jgi:3-dehydroquinate dehydratase
MIQQETGEQREQRLEEEKQNREFYLADERAKEAHERRLKKIEVSVKKTTHLSDAIRDVLIAVVEMPIKLVLALFLPAIILSGREVPKFLQDMFR